MMMMMTMMMMMMMMKSRGSEFKFLITIELMYQSTIPLYPCIIQYSYKPSSESRIIFTFKNQKIIVDVYIGACAYDAFADDKRFLRDRNLGHYQLNMLSVL